MFRTFRAAFGLVFLAALSIIGTNVIAASATVTGHFTSDSAVETLLDISEPTGTAHALKVTGGTTEVTCHKATYNSKIMGATVISVIVTPTYENCTDQSGGAASVTMNGCRFEIKSRTTGHGTTHLLCSAGVKVQVHAAGNTLSFSPQTPTKGGLTYTTTTENGKHALTVDVTAEELHYECHGTCMFSGTNRVNGTLTGSVTVTGTDPNGSPINITST